jgi:hypothetical protein
MSGCFLFFGVALLIRFLDDGRWHRALLLGVCAVLVYFGHVLSYFCFGVLAIALCLQRAREWRRGLYAAGAMLPSLILAAIMFRSEKPQSPFWTRPDDFKAAWHDFPASVMEFPRRVLEIYPGVLDTVVLVVLAATTALLIYWQRREPGDRGGTPTLKLVLAMLALLYLCVPFEITAPFWWWFVSARIPALIAPMLLLWPAVRIEGRTRWLLVPVVLACTVLPLRLAGVYGDFSRRNAGFMRLVEQLPRGALTLVVYRGMKTSPGSQEQSGDPATSGPVHWHFSSWPMALKGGYSAYTFNVGFPLKPKKAILAPLWTAQSNFVLRDFPEWEYYLIHDAPEDMDREPSLKLLDEAGEWKLYHREHALTDEP